MAQARIGTLLDVIWLLNGFIHVYFLIPLMHSFQVGSLNVNGPETPEKGSNI